SMGEPEVDAVAVRVERDAPYRPGVIQSQEFGEKGGAAHGRGCSWEGGRHERGRDPSDSLAGTEKRKGGGGFGGRELGTLVPHPRHSHAQVCSAGVGSYALQTRKNLLIEHAPP